MLTLLWQTALTVLSVIAAAVVYVLPAREQLLLPTLGVSLLGFLLANHVLRHRQKKLLTQASRHNFLPTLEVSLIAFALLLAIAITGGYSSWLLPLYLIYFLLLNFVCPLFPTLTSFVCTLVFFYLSTPDFGRADYGSLLSLIVFAPIAIALQNIYAKLLLEQQNAKLEREKVAYYNLYAEKQQAQLLASGQDQSLREFVQALVPQIDELQKMSRFSENQLIISATLTKLGLSIRQALKNDEHNHHA